MPAPATSRFNRYLTVILRWLLIAFVVFVSTIFTGVYITDNWLPKVCTATAQIQIRARGVTAIPAPDPNYHSTPFYAEFAIMESPDVLLPIITDLGLDKEWAKRVFKSKEDQLTDAEALAYMQKILHLDYKRGTNIVEITASSEVPKEAADIANALADRYKTMRDVEEDQRSSRISDALREQIARQQKIVGEKKAALGKMREELAKSPIEISGSLTTPPSQEQTALLQRFRDAQRDLDQQQNLLDALNVRSKQAIDDRQLQESPVRIISRAEPPESPSKPNKTLCLIVTILAAGFLSVMAASFVEIILLLLRASESPGD